MSSWFGIAVGQVWSGSVWIAYRDGGRIDRFEEGSGFRPTAFQRQRWGQPGDRVVSLLALPARDGSSGLRCVALVETGSGPGLKQALLLFNGASWVKKVGRGWHCGGIAKNPDAAPSSPGVLAHRRPPRPPSHTAPQHETTAPGQRLFSLSGGTTLGYLSGTTVQSYYLAVLEAQPAGGARLLELRTTDAYTLPPAFAEVARFECAPGVACGPLDLRTARVDVLDRHWAVAASLVPAGGGAQRLASFATIGGVWRPGAPAAVPATELAGVQALPPHNFLMPPPFPFIFSVATRGMGVLYANSTAFPLR